MKSTKDLLAFHMLNGYNDEILNKLNNLKEYFEFEDDFHKKLNLFKYINF